MHKHTIWHFRWNVQIKTINYYTHIITLPTTHTGVTSARPRRSLWEAASTSVGLHKCLMLGLRLLFVNSVSSLEEDLDTEWGKGRISWDHLFITTLSHNNLGKVMTADLSLPCKSCGNSSFGQLLPRVLREGDPWKYSSSSPSWHTIHSHARELAANSLTELPQQPGQHP